MHRKHGAEAALDDIVKLFAFVLAFVFFEWAKPGIYLYYFHSFHNAKTNIAQCEYVSINDKAWMVCSGLETVAAGWKAQTNPLSYGGTPKFAFIC